ncbi:MAG TPA: hypothetical protein VIL71_06380 [Spirillospora sp.]
MSDLGRVLRLDARRSAPLVAVPVLTVVGTAAAAASLHQAVAYWDNAVVALINAIRFAGPVAAALGAWTAVRERPLDYLRDLTARSPATGALFDLMLLSAAALVSYATVTALVVAVTLAQNGAGRFHLAGVAAGAGSLVLHVVAGYLAGRVIPHRATAALAFAVTSLWAMLRVPGTSWWSLLPPAALDRTALYTTLRSRVLIDQLIWTTGLTTALVLAYVTWVTRRLIVVLPLLVALAATAVAALGLRGSGGTVTPVNAEPVCRRWPLTVCVHPALRDALPALTAAATPLAARLHGTPGAFTRVEQRPAWTPVSVSGGVAVVHLDDRLTPGYASRAVRQISRSLRDAAACASSPDSPDHYRALVDAWLLDEDLPKVPDARAARSFASWSEARRRTWLRLHFTDYRTCALKPADFLADGDFRGSAAAKKRNENKASKASKKRKTAARRALGDHGN